MTTSATSRPPRQVRRFTEVMSDPQASRAGTELAEAVYAHDVYELTQASSEALRTLISDDQGRTFEHGTMTWPFSRR